MRFTEFVSTNQLGKKKCLRAISAAGPKIDRPSESEKCRGDPTPREREKKDLVCSSVTTYKSIEQ